ncbi:MAG TPA: N-acyl homoserine lactonase family protein [Candidatus Limnocylindrales bacterium]|nr:N-acyl homoserine lactonase family protein [Candidatus Limnocylindrales bacterium]
MTNRSVSVQALPLGDFTFPDDAPWPGEAGLVVGYAIRHPAGVLLFDTGFVLIEESDPELDGFYAKYRIRPRPVLEALERAGIDRGEITAIANCHLHLDHCGQNGLFPGVPIYVQPAELEAAGGEDYTVARVFNFEGAHLQPRAGDHEIAPGIRIFATPGHSPGHQSLVVETPDGPLLLAGQAVYSAGEWAGTTGARDGSDDSRADHDAYAGSVARLRALRPKRVLFGHDRHGWPD